MKEENMRTRKEILKRVDELSKMVASGAFTHIMEAHQTGIVSGLQWALEGEHGKPDTETETTINIKLKLDKEAYRQFKIDMSEIEAEYKSNDEYTGRLKDACEWWIKIYPEHNTLSSTRHGLIRFQMKQLLKEMDGKKT